MNLSPGGPSIFNIIRDSYGFPANKAANTLLRMNIQLITAREQLIFNLRCKRNNILPKSLRLNPPIRNAQGYSIARRNGFSYLRCFIGENHKKINYLNYQLPHVERNLRNIISYAHYQELLKCVLLKSSRKKVDIKRHLQRKFDRLMEPFLPVVDYSCVTNLSSKTLNNDHFRVLQKGLNYSLNHRKNDIVNSLATIEPVISDLNTSEDNKNELRQRVINCFQSIPKVQNLTKLEKYALNDLKNDNSIKIAKSDKGNRTVIIDKEEYESKVKENLEDPSTYKKLATNPINKLQRVVNNDLKKLKDLNKIEESTYLNLRAKTATCPRFYALIKTHKENNPIRGIVSFIGSPTYSLAKFMSKLLMPLTNVSTHKLKNTFEIKTFLESKIIPTDNILVSFDVKNLFTNISHEFILQSVESFIDDDQNFLANSCLDKDEILSLVKLCLTSTAFKWNEEFYSQIKGTPMGSPISVVLAEISMQNFEKIAFTNCPYPILFWKRYVDDSITCVKRNDLQNFFVYLNSINNNFKFTFEAESNGILNYLDIKIKRNNSNSLSFTVFRKEMHSGQYLNFKSNNPLSHKKCVALSLFNRAKQICSPSEKPLESAKIINDLKKNNYPLSFIKNCQYQINNPTHINESNSYNSFRYVSVPYIHGVSEKLSRIFSPFSIKIAHKPSNKIVSSISKLKDPIATFDKSSIIYQIPCKNCPNSYIGESGRELKIRLNEHKKDVSQYNMRSLVAQHVLENGHQMDWENTKVLNIQKNIKSRRVLESLYSKKHKSFNRFIDVPGMVINQLKKFA